MTTYNGGIGYELFNHSQVNDAFSVIWNHIFSPTFLNEARANAAGWRYNELASNPQAPFGLPQGLCHSAIGTISIGNLGVGRTEPSGPVDLRLQGCRHQGPAHANHEVRL